MKFPEKINFNFIIITPLLILCTQWAIDGKYIAFILTLIFGFVLFGIIDEQANTSDEEE